MTLIDERIKTDIVNRLRWDTRIDASKILVEVDNRMVRLMGTVPTNEARRTAFEQARNVPGVGIVDNQLVILYPSEVALPTDAEIETRAKSVLNWNSDIDISKVHVEVDSGVVTLKGSVIHYWQRYKAEELVSNLLGVLSVKNELTVVPTEKIVDELIAEDIIAEFERSNLVEADKVAVKVNDGVVTLSGNVYSYAAEKRVYDVAAHTLGVRGVINNVSVFFE